MSAAGPNPVRRDVGRRGRRRALGGTGIPL